jgi:hypothetical protein
MSDNQCSPLTLRWVDDAVRHVRVGLDIGKEKTEPSFVMLLFFFKMCFFLLLYFSLLVDVE